MTSQNLCLTYKTRMLATLEYMYAFRHLRSWFGFRVWVFREYSRFVFTGRCKEPKGDGEQQEGASRGRYVTRARSWWKRGDVSACAAHSNMECWVHHDTILDDDQANQRLKEVWEHDDSKDELKVDLQGLERHFWLGTEARRLGCYNIPGETWAGDGSAHKGVMGAGSVCLQQQSKYLEVRVKKPSRRYRGG
jgi:hypothetical protein